MRSEEIIEKRDDKPTANGICNGAKADISAAPNHLHREKYRVINQVLYAKSQPGKLRRADVERVERVVAQMGKLEKGNTKADDHNAHQHTGHAPEGDMLFHNHTPVVLPGRTKVELMNKYAYNLLQQKCNMSTLKGQYRNLWLVIHSSLPAFGPKTACFLWEKFQNCLYIVAVSFILICMSENCMLCAYKRTQEGNVLGPALCACSTMAAHDLRGNDYGKLF